MNLYKKFSFRIRHHIIRDNPSSLKFISHDLIVRDQLEKKMIKKFCILKDRNGSGSVKVWGYLGHLHPLWVRKHSPSSLNIEISTLCSLLSLVMTFEDCLNRNGKTEISRDHELNCIWTTVNMWISNIWKRYIYIYIYISLKE